MKLVYSIVVSFVILLSINAFTMLQHNHSTKEEANIAQAFQLMPENNLYK